MTNPGMNDEKDIIEQRSLQEGTAMKESIKGSTSKVTLPPPSPTNQGEVPQGKKQQHESAPESQARKVFILEEKDLGILRDEIPPNLRPNMECKVHHATQGSKNERTTTSKRE